MPTPGRRHLGTAGNSAEVAAPIQGIRQAAITRWQRPLPPGVGSDASNLSRHHGRLEWRNPDSSFRSDNCTLKL